MKNEEIRNRILAICRNCVDISFELDTEVFDDVFPEIEECGRIGKFFIVDDCLYYGETCGDPQYWPIGRCDDLQQILYRKCEEDREVQFCFEFSDMLFVLTYHARGDYELKLIRSGNKINDEKEILAILKSKLDASSC